MILKINSRKVLKECLSEEILKIFQMSRRQNTLSRRNFFADTVFKKKNI
jgi:hypothetical protein